MDPAPDTTGRRSWYGATVLLAASLVVWLLAGPEHHPTAYVLGVDLTAAALLVTTTRSTRAGRRARHATLFGAALLVALAIARAGIESIGDVVTTVLILLVAIAVPVLVMRDVLRRRTVDLELVLAAVTVYLLIGIFCSMAFSLAGSIATDPLFAFPDSAAPRDGNYRDHVYVSFVTVSTTGYGDIVPVSGTARAIAIMSALMGQLYLVTAVATAVSRFSASRLRDHAGG